LIGKKGAMKLNLWQMSWLVKAVFLGVVLSILVSIFMFHINRDYDVRELEMLAMEERVRFCVSEFDDLENCFSGDNYAAKISFENEEVIINEGLYDDKPLCVFKKKFSCSESSIAVDGVEYKLDLIIEKVS